MAHVNRKEYLIIFIWLTVLTAIEVGVALMDMDKTLLVSGLIALAIGKAALVALFYMHLNHETNFFKWTVAIPLAFPPCYGLVLIAEATWRMLP